MAIGDRVKAHLEALEIRRWHGLRTLRIRVTDPIGRSIRVEMPFSSKRIVAALGASGYRVDER